MQNVHPVFGKLAAKRPGFGEIGWAFLWQGAWRAQLCFAGFCAARGARVCAIWAKLRRMLS
jgi:hypothetical protein